MAVTLPTFTDVRAIITTSLTDDQITAIIADAALFVEGCVSSLPDATGTAIIKWTAAHMIALSGQGGQNAMLTSKKLGDASETYAKPTTGTGYWNTWWGGQAVMLDPNGCLRGLGKRPVIMKVL